MEGPRCFKTSNCNATVDIPSPSNSSVSSDPLRVCLCDSSGTPQCENSSYTLLKMGVYPGAAFKLSTVLIGGDFGLTTGIVYSNIYAMDYATAPLLSLLPPYSPLIGNIQHCHIIEYSIILYSQNNMFVVAYFSAVHFNELSVLN